MSLKVTVFQVTLGLSWEDFFPMSTEFVDGIGFCLLGAAAAQ